MTREDERYRIVLHELVRRVGESIRRLRVVEQRLDTLENRVNGTEEGALERMKKYNKKFSDVEVMLKNLNDEIIKLKSNVEKINRQINKFARKGDIKEVERTFELLSPLKITQDLEKIKVES